MTIDELVFIDNVHVMRLFIWLWLCSLLLFWTSLAWTIQSPDLIESWYISFPKECEVKEGVVLCWWVHAIEWERLSSKLVKLLEVLDSLDRSWETFRANYLRSTIKEATPVLKSMNIRAKWSKRRFQTGYVHAVFQDINSFYSKKNQSITMRIPEWIEEEQEIHDYLRKAIIKQLVTRWYDNFVKKPFAWDALLIDTMADDWEKYDMYAHVAAKDDLDRYIASVLWWNAYDIVVDESTYASRKPIHLFKDKSDLESLWYDIVSHRERTNTDEEYRRTNISKSFSLVWRLNVINPWETISFLEDSLFDPQYKYHYLTWKIIFLDEEVEWYGWWLCWWSTAFYQWTVMNTWLSIESRNHSKRYSSLYTATINWEKITTPWLDSTIYSPSLDLKITNTAWYPIVLVATYDANHWTQEKVFTLWRKSERWSIEYVSSYNKSYTINQKWWESRVVQWRCYKRIINWEEVRRCYKEIF